MTRRKFFGLLCSAVLLGCPSRAPAAAAEKPDPIKSGEHYRIYGMLAGRKLALDIVPTDGWKLNLKAPLRLKVTSTGEAKPARELWTSRDARRWEEKRCRLEIPLRGALQGVLTLQFDFVICTDTLCQKKKFSFDYRLTPD